MQLHLPADADSRAAAVITGVVLCLFGAALMRIPAPNPRAPAGDDALTVILLAPPREVVSRAPAQSATKPLANQRWHRPRTRPAAAVNAVLQSTIDGEERGQTLPEPSAPALDLRLPPGLTTEPRAASGNREAFGHVERPRLEPPPRADFKVRDRSLAGRLASMTRYQVCGELRGALREASGSQAQVIVRTMQEHGCI